MKHLTFLLAAVMAPTMAGAQIPVPAESPLVNKYIADTYAQRSDAWWQALESQLLLMLDKPAAEVDENSLRNIIFFAHNHPDKVALGKAAPKLLDVYVGREDIGYRILALAALHAIGDEAHLRQAFRVARARDSERLRKMTHAALADLYQQR